jgi:hypothetical protein
MTFVWDDKLTGLVNQERTATISFLDDDVSAMYVDWGDGASNKKTEANYQWLEFSEPLSSTTATHTYTGTGSFFPIVQTINSRGFISRYYGPAATETDVKPYSQDTGIENILVSDASPTAVMRAQNISVNSGIDNSILEDRGPQQAYVIIAPTLTLAELNSIGKIDIEITGYVNYNKYSNTAGAGTFSNWTSTASQQTIKLTVPLTGTPSGSYSILTNGGFVPGSVFSKILKVKFLSPKSNWSGATQTNTGVDYTKNELFNRLKIFVCVSTGLPWVGYADFYPIAYVTAGCPIKSVDDNNSFSTLDFSQSRAAASNVLLSNYRYDIGKGWFSPAYQWALSSTILGTETKQTSTLKPAHYTYMTRPNGMNGVLDGSYHTQAVFWGAGKWYTDGTAVSETREDQVLIDDFGRFYPQYHNVRLSVVAASTSGSSIVTNQPEVYLMNPSPNWLDDADNILQTPVTDYTTKMKNNGEANGWIMTNLNPGGQKDVLNVTLTHQGNDFILLAFDTPTNNIFFETTNYANGLMSALSGYDDSGLKIAGVEYLHVEEPNTKTQNAFWKPVEFVDTTKITREYKDDTDEEYKSFSTSLATSGYIRFDRPVDWSPSTIKQLCGGVYNTLSGSIGTLAGTAGAIQPGADDIVITGTCTTGAENTGYGRTVDISNTTDADLKDKMLTLGTINEVGAYKYALIIATGTASGSMFWLASGGANGWDGDQQISVNIGTHDTLGASDFNQNYEFPQGTITGTVRRINIYDVIPGASKQFAINRDTNDYLTSSFAGGTGSIEVIPAGGEIYNAGTSYFKNLYNMYDADIITSPWATADKYILKLTLSGATDAGTLDNPTPELWNIFDAQQGDSAIIEEVDTSAYNLNSLAITSDLSMRAAGQYFKAISRRGKVFVVKTGIGISTVNFSSVALGDELSSDAFDSHGPSTLYGHLHMIRRIQAEAVNVYWDEPQKDGTFLRLYGLVTDVAETRAVGGPRAVMSYNFNVVIKEIALLNNKGSLMTDLYPLGGIQDERDYS